MSIFVKKKIVFGCRKKSFEMSDNGGIVPPSSGGTSETPNTESSDAKGNLNLNEVLSFLRKNGLTGAEQLLSKQFSSSANAVGGSGPSGTGDAAAGGSSADSNVLSSYKADSDPGIHAEAYKDLQVCGQNFEFLPVS